MGCVAGLGADLSQRPMSMGQDDGRCHSIIHYDGGRRGSPGKIRARARTRKTVQYTRHIESAESAAHELVARIAVYLLVKL